MFNQVWVISLQSGLTAAGRTDFVRSLRELSGTVASEPDTLIEPTLPGVYNGGDLLWRLQFADEASHSQAHGHSQWRAEINRLLQDRDRVSHVDGATYASALSGGKSPPQGVYRLALFSARPQASPRALAQFTSETAQMADYIHSIRRWQLSPVIASEGARRWSFVWEQEYDDLAGLMGPYMMHPYHWAHIDRWFDPESTDWLIDRHLVHTYCNVKRPVIG